MAMAMAATKLNLLPKGTASVKTIIKAVLDTLPHLNRAQLDAVTKLCESRAEAYAKKPRDFFFGPCSCCPFSQALWESSSTAVPPVLPPPRPAELAQPLDPSILSALALLPNLIQSVTALVEGISLQDGHISDLRTQYAQLEQPLTDFSRSKNSIITRLTVVEKKVEEDLAKSAAKQSLWEAAEAVRQRQEEGRKKVNSRIFEEEKGRSAREDSRKDNERKREEGERRREQQSKAVKLAEDRRGEHEHKRQVLEEGRNMSDDAETKLWWRSKMRRNSARQRSFFGPNKLNSCPGL
jgi:hypothetical protein